MPTRPLFLVAALASGDYLLWTWSSEGNSTTLALISGLALAPLILALLWLLSVGIARALLSRSSSPTSPRAAAKRRGASRRRAIGRLARAAQGRNRASATAAAGRWEDEEGDMSKKRQAPSEKIAA